MSVALLALTIVLAPCAALAFAVRSDNHLDRELRRLDRITCPTTCTACPPAARRAPNGDHSP
ncbi:hypothetical protein ACIRU3_13095 [Streptomyces sp. NPDC101151]|uniref:hypothetical protein n=1 Tax=Streptomyces sp. NPDC101151 TaxID=3366115 RepID=UPI0037FF51BE